MDISDSAYERCIQSADEDRTLRYYEDIEVAEKTINELLLDQLYANPIADIYCIPSHNHQTFYVKVFIEEGRMVLVYAKPMILTPSGERIVMYRFKDCICHDCSHPGYGNIYCGVKKVSLNEDSLINTILSVLPPLVFHPTAGICIDGVFTCIRTFENNKQLGEIAYLDASDLNTIHGLHLSAQQVHDLNDLYITIENLIGNLNTGL